MTRNRDRLIDKKIGSVIRMQRVKLRMSQSDLGNFLGVTFQQIQKYENGGNAVASTRIPALCQTLEISPNDLFGVSARMDGELSQLAMGSVLSGSCIFNFFRLVGSLCGNTVALSPLSPEACEIQ